MIDSESQTFSKENVRQVQGYQEKGQDPCYLRQPQAQAASGLSFFLAYFGAAVLFTASFRVRGSIFSELRETFYQVSLLT